MFGQMFDPVLDQMFGDYFWHMRTFTSHKHAFMDPCQKQDKPVQTFVTPPFYRLFLQTYALSVRCNPSPPCTLKLSES